MKTGSLLAIQKALDSSNVRFIVVGGIAVIAHGYLRATRDADIVIELVPDNIQRAFSALESIGYRPSVPVSAEEFSDEENRERWQREKGMRVLKFWSDEHRETPLDVFIDHPFPFDEEWEKCLLDVMQDGGPASRYASIETLIEMKKEAARPRDLDDIEHLEQILRLETDGKSTD
ncbi:MAG: DUF6036 family nucleotidyltransferase [Verrucomicrobiota bacterium]